MLEDLKNVLLYKSIDNLIKNKKYDEALEKLNILVKVGYEPIKVILKRGILCKNLLLSDDAYNDFTYIIDNYSSNLEAYKERMLLNYELEKYKDAIKDAEVLINNCSNDFEVSKCQIFSCIFLGDYIVAKELILNLFDSNIYKIIQFILNECAKLTAENEFSKGLKLLEIIETIDQNNPIKLLNEANIYEFTGNIAKKQEILSKINTVFPSYFLTHYKFSDIYEDRDLLETCFLLELKNFDKYNLFSYQMCILEGYKQNIEGHIIDSKETFERAISINPEQPDAYVLLAETLQLMSGYDNPDCKLEANKYYEKALDIYQKQNLTLRAENMRKQIKHLNSTIVL